MHKLLVFIDSDWQRVDLPETSIALTFQGNDIASLNDRQASISQNIALPLTPNNKRIFAFLSEPGAFSLLPYDYYPCRLFFNDRNIFGFNSVMKIISVSQSEINIQVLGSLSDVFQKMKNTLLTDLSDEAFPSFLFLRPLNNLIIRNQARDVLYSTFCLGQTEEGETYNKEWYLINFHNLIRKLVAFFGYTLIDNVKQEDKQGFYLSLPQINASSEKTFEPLDEQGVFSVASYHCLNYQPGNLSYRWRYYSFPLTIRQNTGEHLTLRSASSLGNNANGQINNDNMAFASQQAFRSEYLADFTGKISLEALLRFQISLSETINNYQAIKTYLVLCKNGEVIKKDFDSFSFSEGQQSPITTIAFRVEVEVKQGDVLSLCALCCLPGQERMGIYFKVLENSIFKISYLESLTVPKGGRLFVKDNLTGFATCEDLFKAYLSVFGLMPIVDNESKTLYCYSFDEVFLRKSLAKDWTNRLVAFESKTLQFTFSSYAQINYLKFKENEEEENKASFLIDNPTLEKQKDVVTFPFYCNKTIEEKPFLDLYEKDSETLAWTFKGGKEYLIKGNRFVESEYLLNNYYNRLRDNILRRAFVVELTLLLTLEDIISYDVFTPVYLSQFGAYFYINKISNYLQGKTCKATLVRIS